MSMSDKDGYIWYNGKLQEWRATNIHVLTHSLHYGVAVFEGIRAYQTEKGPAIFQLQLHTDRLFDSAKIMGMKIPYSPDEINQATIDAVRSNKLPNAYIRPIAFFGSESMGIRATNLSVNVAISAWEWKFYISQEAIDIGIDVKTSSYTRHHVNAMMTKAKCSGAYVNSMLALQEAVANGADEALLLDTEGYVAEGSGENIFVIKNGIIYTPEITSCLNGITRNTVIQLATDLGYQIVEKRITRDEIYISDEAFFTGSAAEITPIKTLDNREIGKGHKGPITNILQNKYFDVVRGKDIKYLDWLTFI